MFFQTFLNKDVNVSNFNVIEVYRWCYTGPFSVCKYYMKAEAFKWHTILIPFQIESAVQFN